MTTQVVGVQAHITKVSLLVVIPRPFVNVYQIVHLAYISWPLN